MTEAIHALIRLRLHAQIPTSFLNQYSSSSHYGLSSAVAQVYALNYSTDNDKEYLQIGISIFVSFDESECKRSKVGCDSGRPQF